MSLEINGSCRKGLRDELTVVRGSTRSCRGWLLFVPPRNLLRIKAWVLLQECGLDDRILWLQCFPSRDLEEVSLIVSRMSERSAHSGSGIPLELPLLFHHRLGSPRCSVVASEFVSVFLSFGYLIYMSAWKESRSLQVNEVSKIES